MNTLRQECGACVAKSYAIDVKSGMLQGYPGAKPVRQQQGLPSVVRYRGLAQALLILVCWGTVLPAIADDLQTQDIWTLRAPSGKLRWVIIHQRDVSASGNLYHVEVLERGRGDPAWHFRHLAAHLAVTEEVLHQAVLKPQRRGGVYPESYLAAYRSWKDASAEQPVICRSTLEACLKP